VEIGLWRRAVTVAHSNQEDHVATLPGLVGDMYLTLMRSSGCLSAEITLLMHEENNGDQERIQPEPQTQQVVATIVITRLPWI